MNDLQRTDEDLKRVFENLEKRVVTGGYFSRNENVICNKYCKGVMMSGKFTFLNNYKLKWCKHVMT